VKSYANPISQTPCKCNNDKSCGEPASAVFDVSCHGAEQLCLQDEFALLVLLAGLVRFVILPAHCFLALSTVDIAYDVATGGHVALVWLGLGNVDNAVEEVGFAVLAAEVLGDVSWCLECLPWKY
jgi:hypothetical protein